MLVDCAVQPDPHSLVGLFVFALAITMVGLPIGIVELELWARQKLIARGWNIRPC